MRSCGVTATTHAVLGARPACGVGVSSLNCVWGALVDKWGKCDLEFINTLTCFFVHVSVSSDLYFDSYSENYHHTLQP